MARRLLALAIVPLAAGVVAAAAVAAGEYRGDARAIALTAAQADYKALTGSGTAPKPPADKRRGYRSGWQASYLKGTAAKPVEAFSVIYVYDTAANARRAYASSCKDCSKSVRYQAVTMKYLLSKAKPPVVTDIAVCRNVYVAAVVSGDVATQALAEEAGSLAGLVFAKAAANGMASCAT